MSYPPKGILARLQCAIITEEVPIPLNCAMYYAETNPYEVVFVSEEQTADGKPVEWHYSRELISQALSGEPETVYGEGDVQTFCENEFFFTKLARGDSMVLLAFAQRDIQHFFQATTEIVPFGEEAIQETDIDAFLSEVLGPEA